MTQYTLTVLDLTGIQNYIFSSNKLKHIIGASQLVYESTHDWVYHILPELGPTNINPDNSFNEKTIVDHQLKSELVYAGGGNAVIIFQNHDIATDFTQRLTRYALVNAPGLELVITHVEFNWNDSLKKVVDDAFKALAQKKAHRSRSQPILGLGVTAACQYRGTPAVGIEKEQDEADRLVSAEVEAKLNVVDKANKRLMKEYWLQNCKFASPLRADHFGRSHGESSYLAIVHADGNAMSKRKKAIAEQYQEPSLNCCYITAMREFSEKVKEAAKTSLLATIKKLDAAVNKTNDTIGGVIELYQEDGEAKKYLPFRPLIFGGDDLTFVCEGRLGLELTAFYLRHFTDSHRFPPDDTPIYARAGVAVVKTHYPFGQAYKLAEELAKSAKKYLQEDYLSEQQKERLSTLDWHFGVGGLILDLKTIREREYTVDTTGKLTMRPLWVAGEAHDWRSWDVFSQMVSKFQKGDNWAGRRNKVKALRDALRGGSSEVKAFLHNFNCCLPDVVTGTPSLVETGWVGDRCGYFDAIEALDFFIPLEES